MANYVGVELGSAQVRVLEAEGSAKKLKVKKFATAELRAPGVAAASAFLEKEAGQKVDDAFSKAKISREPVAMSWDSEHTIFRELDLPFTSADQIQKVIKYEAESHLLNLDIDDVVVSFYKLAEERDKSHLMVMAARKDLIRNRLDAISQAGVDPLVIDLDVMAAFNALSATGYTERHKSFMVLDCGRRTTNLLLIVGGRMIAGRAIRMGSDALTSRIAEDLEAEPAAIAGSAKNLLTTEKDARKDDLVVPARSLEDGDKPETAKLPAELAHDLAVQRADDFHRKLSREVKRTLITTKIPEPIEVVYVTGAASLLPGFAEGMARQLGIEAPLQPLDLLAHVDSALPAAESQATEAEMLTALGLAFKLAGHDATGIDFRQEDLRYARRFDQIREPLVYLCGLLLFFVVLLNLYDVRKVSLKKPFLFGTKDADMTRIVDAAMLRYQAAVGKEATLPAQFQTPSLRSLEYVKQQLNGRIQAMKGELGRGGAIPELPSAFDMWRQTFDAIQAKMGTIGKLIVYSFHSRVRGEKEPFVELTGLTPNASAYSDLIQALKQINGVSIKEGQTEDQGDNGYKFTRLTVVFPPSADSKGA